MPFKLGPLELVIILVALMIAAAIVVFIVFLLKKEPGGRPASKGVNNTTKERYAKGEISRAEIKDQDLINSDQSYFDGGLLQLLGWRILGWLVTIFTLGICYPWSFCMIYRWEAKHTVINGRRLQFDGTALQLLGNWLLWLFLCYLTLGIYSFWLSISLKKWQTKHTFFVDSGSQPITPHIKEQPFVAAVPTPPPPQPRPQPFGTSQANYAQHSAGPNADPLQGNEIRADRGIVFCQKCGTQNNANNQYCNYCNRPLTDARNYSRPYQAAPDNANTGKWFWSLLLLCIPIVGLVMLFVWGFGNDVDKRRNFARAILLWYLVGVVVGIVCLVIPFAITCSRAPYTTRPATPTTITARPATLTTTSTTKTIPTTTASIPRISSGGAPVLDKAPLSLSTPTHSQALASMCNMCHNAAATGNSLYPMAPEWAGSTKTPGPWTITAKSDADHTGRSDNAGCMASGCHTW